MPILKKLLTISILLSSLLNASIAQANIPSQISSKSHDYIQSVSLGQSFDISGTEFFISITTPNNIENPASFEIITPKNNLRALPSTQDSNQEIWVINKDWQSAPAHQGNSFVTLTPVK